MAELRGLLRPRGITVCEGSLDERVGASLAFTSNSETVIIGVVALSGQTPDRSEFELSALPRDTYAFALARSLDEVFQQADLIPPPPIPEPTAEAIPEPTGEPMPDADSPSEPMADALSQEAAEIEGRSLGWTLMGGATLYGTADPHLGGAIGGQLRLGRWLVELDVAGSGAIPRRSEVGTVQAATVGSGLALSLRVVDDDAYLSVGALARVAAVFVQGTPNDPTRTLGGEAWAPVVHFGGKIVLGWSAASRLGLQASLEVTGSAVGVDVVHEGAPLASVEGIATSLQLGFVHLAPL